MRLIERPFEDIVETLPTTKNTKAYVEHLLNSQIHKPIDMSKTSMVLAMYESNAVDLEKFQTIGDWILWVSSFFPKHVEAHAKTARSIGRLSYFRCFKLVPTWRVYEELADTMPNIIHHINSKSSLT